jgi:nucleoside-diphosphate-sugar epimerase
MKNHHILKQSTMATESSLRPTVLVTGCGGFIGHRLCQELLELKYDIVGVDECNSFYSPETKRKRIKELSWQQNFHCVQSLEDFQVCEGQFISTAFHLAGQASMSYCQKRPDEAFHCNEELTKTLLNKIASSTHVIFTSEQLSLRRCSNPLGRTYSSHAARRICTLQAAV